MPACMRLLCLELGSDAPQHPPSMSAGKHSNTSQFYITLAAAPQCDGKHVVIGRLVDGLEVLQQIGEGRLLMLCWWPGLPR